MTRTTLRSIAAAIGAGTFLGCGWALGTVWWIPAGIGAAAVAGSWLDHRLASVAVLASLGVVAGAIDADTPALIVVITVGLVAAVELFAVADRISIVRPSVSALPPVLGGAVTAGGVTAAVVAVGAVDGTRPIGAAIVAAVAAAVALRVLVR